jgi:hypothetical protein
MHGRSVGLRSKAHGRALRPGVHHRRDGEFMSKFFSLSDLFELVIR